jgi:hypothetical protein
VSVTADAALAAPDQAREPGRVTADCGTWGRHDGHRGPCQTCGKCISAQGFWGKPNPKYCSDACRQKAYRARKKAKPAVSTSRYNYDTRRIEFTFSAEDEAALDRAWDEDPTKSKYRYNKLWKSITLAALEAGGFRYGKPHWCGGSSVLYDIPTWERWDKANPKQCSVTPASGTA